VKITRHATATATSENPFLDLQPQAAAPLDLSGNITPQGAAQWTSYTVQTWLAFSDPAIYESSYYSVEPPLYTAFHPDDYLTGATFVTTPAGVNMFNPYLSADSFMPHYTVNWGSVVHDVVHFGEFAVGLAMNFGVGLALDVQGFFSDSPYDGLSEGSTIQADSSFDLSSDNYSDDI
jgi:hypothetical protein